jgi:hypothetical protein
MIIKSYVQIPGDFTKKIYILNENILNIATKFILQNQLKLEKLLQYV